MSSPSLSSSFRDPSGFVFLHEGEIYRQVNQRYRKHYDTLMSSGLYEELVAGGLLVPHEEAAFSLARGKQAYKIIRPARIPFVSYPYEWSFSQYKDAALATLAIQKAALKRGMTLKDSSAFNIQFYEGRPVLIDTLSFEIYREGAPWIAYRQYCEHFLAPLALMAYRDVRLSQLLRSLIDGVPVDLASELLPASTKVKGALLVHLHLHAKSQRRHRNNPSVTKSATVSRRGLEGILDNLESGTASLTLKRHSGIWADYYSETNYTPAAADHKIELVDRYIDQARPEEVWDLGANVGRYSRISADRGIFTVSIDSDPGAVEANYLACRDSRNKTVLPLLIDLTNPSSSLGWAHEERMSLRARGPADLVMALALIHHLVISNNTPMARVAAYFASLGRDLIIEFVPKEDSQVQRLLASREDIFDSYTREGFEAAFCSYYSILQRDEIADSKRTLYLLRALNDPRPGELPTADSAR